MGYFRRKLDRGRAAAEAESLREEATGPDTWPLWEESSTLSRERKYLRFAVSVPHPDTRRSFGIFHATTLLDPDRMDPAIAERLEAALSWFDEHVRAPDDNEVTDERAIFFFKSWRPEILSWLWELAWILREEGLEVRLQALARPGRVVYEDEDQVAILPYRTTPDP